MSDTLSTQRLIFRLLDPTLEELGYELVAAEILTIDDRLTLRVSIDKPGGVGVDDCSEVSHAISPLLDVEDPIASAYYLEVSSPGIDRPLQREGDFERFAGYRAKLRLLPVPGRRRYTGDLAGLQDGNVLIDVDGQRFELPHEQIEKAHLVLTLEQYQALAEAPPAGDGGDEPQE